MPSGVNSRTESPSSFSANFVTVLVNVSSPPGGIVVSAGNRNGLLPPSASSSSHSARLTLPPFGFMMRIHSSVPVGGAGRKAVMRIVGNEAGAAVAGAV